MKKSGLFLALVGSLIGIGIILSVFGNYLIFEDLSKGDIENAEQDLIIETELDNTQTGIYAVQITELEGAEVSANILDPFDSTIETHRVNDEIFEGSFEVSTSGTYTLLIENSGESVKIFGVIGPEPEEWKKSINIISFIILAAGLIGMVGLAIYIIINRKRKS